MKKTSDLGKSSNLSLDLSKVLDDTADMTQYPAGGKASNYKYGSQMSNYKGTGSMVTIEEKKTIEVEQKEPLNITSVVPPPPKKKKLGIGLGLTNEQIMAALKKHLEALVMTELYKYGKATKVLTEAEFEAQKR